MPHMNRGLKFAKSMTTRGRDNADADIDGMEQYKVFRCDCKSNGNNFNN